MNFNIISPITRLNEYATLSRSHLVLQHILHADYAEFYRKRKLIEGDFLILDNGAYEGARMPTLDEYRHNINFYRPDVCVLPDYLLQPWGKTFNAATRFLDDISGTTGEYEPQWLYIPQAEPGRLEDWNRSLEQILNDARVTWIGIPRALSTHIARDRLARVEAARHIRRVYPSIHMHAFGMVDGDIHELPYLEDAGVESVDSSAPVWRGWLGYSLTEQRDMKHWRTVGRECNFWANVLPRAYEHKMILHNLEACGVNTGR